MGVCFATAAPGAVHLLNGLYDAKIDGAPVLAITGMTYHDLIGTRYLQDINQDYLYQDVALYNQRLMGPTHVENVVELACRAALSNRGVAHVAIPIDMQVMAADEGHRFKRNVKGHTGSSYQPPRRLPEEPLLQEAARLLAGHSKVAILAGSGARGAHAELEQVAERLSAPVIKSLLGKDCLPDTSPYTTGGIGVVGTRPSFAALKECDAFLIIAVASLTSSSCRSPGRQCAGRSTTSRNTSACDTLPTLAWLATPDQRFADCFHTCHVTTTAHFYSRRRSE